MRWLCARGWMWGWPTAEHESARKPATRGTKGGWMICVTTEYTESTEGFIYDFSISDLRLGLERSSGGDDASPSHAVRHRDHPPARPFSVERELDPPVAASGRRGLRPSRDTWRWRPRHRICLPAAEISQFPRNARRRGRRRYGKSSNASIPKCNRKSQIENRKFSNNLLRASREI